MNNFVEEFDRAGYFRYPPEESPADLVSIYTVSKLQEDIQESNLDTSISRSVFNSYAEFRQPMLPRFAAFDFLPNFDLLPGELRFLLLQFRHQILDQLITSL
jgi:hypothetical protein